MINLRQAENSDIPFMKKMLYEAVFWRKSETTPDFETGLNDPEVKKVLAEWGERDGDIAVIAEVDSSPAGAAWLRFWSNENPIRGYFDARYPVLVIGVEEAFRQKGVGQAMLAWLIEYTAKSGIEGISLAVSKDNVALHLYRKMGFCEQEDKGDWWIMFFKQSGLANQEN